ncbi:hypothetical protein EJ02DRAFT_466004 [Clathrospora elynae]|uniref:Uncharacterized protein n=1 Tax=Clathrospora elynae TaxID=706981 RepID=A0A6A5SRH5_9PLEO|nr:hypothetical protein EJ02DRAFT_466004 [Clathrospora elynae]
MTTTMTDNFVEFGDMTTFTTTTIPMMPTALTRQRRGAFTASDGSVDVEALKSAVAKFQDGARSEAAQSKLAKLQYVAKLQNQADAELQKEQATKAAAGTDTILLIMTVVACLLLFTFLLSVLLTKCCKADKKRKRE